MTPYHLIKIKVKRAVNGVTVVKNVFTSVIDLEKMIAPMEGLTSFVHQAQLEFANESNNEYCTARGNVFIEYEIQCKTIKGQNRYFNASRRVGTEPVLYLDPYDYGDWWKRLKDAYDLAKVDAEVAYNQWALSSKKKKNFREN